MKNPYDTNSPEWQLFEVALAADRESAAHATDAERSLAKAAEARAKAELYRDALSRLRTTENTQ